MPRAIGATAAYRVIEGDLRELREQALLGEDEYVRLRQVYGTTLFSLFYELRALLYLAVTLLASGVGLLVYDNIHIIGQKGIIAILTAVVVGLFVFLNKRRAPFSRNLVASPGLVHDYLLVLACLLFAVLVGYVQAKYGIFGERGQLGALATGVVFVFVAYAFDHRGVLALGLTSLASWAGLTVSPVNIFREVAHFEGSLLFCGIAFGLLVDLAALALERAAIKKHFTATALYVGSNILCVSLIVASSKLAASALFTLLLLIVCGLGVARARREQSFVFLLFGCLYAYAGITVAIADWLGSPDAVFLYLLVSCSAVIYFVFNYRRFLTRP